MKKYATLLFVMCAAILSSCTQNPKEVAPKQTAFADGALAELVEIDAAPCMLAYEAPENGTTHVYRMSVKLKLKKETPCLQAADIKKISFDGGNVAIDLLAENGEKLLSMSILKEDKAKLKQLLKGKKGDVQEIAFVGTTENAEKASEWFDQAVSFAAGECCDVYPYVLNLSGNIGKYPVKMTLQVNAGKTIRGAYYYARKSPDALLFLKGFVDENNEVGMSEFNSKGMMCGSHSLQLGDDGSLKGTFMTVMAGTMTPINSFEAQLAPDAEMPTIDFWSKVNFDDCFEVWSNPNYDEDPDQVFED